MSRVNIFATNAYMDIVDLILIVDRGRHTLMCLIKTIWRVHEYTYEAIDLQYENPESTGSGKY